jgi:predicted RNA methylase
MSIISTGITIKESRRSMLPVFTATYTKAAFQPFYTDAQEIRALMLDLLGNVEGLKVLEPCAGQGAFIDGLHGTPSQVDAVDIDERHVALLRQLPGFVRPLHADFIDLFVSGGLLADTILNAHYDAVICNPPYGLRFSIDYRKRIKKRLPQAYARESYGLFMYFAIEALRNDGRYVFIVPDTFLTSRNHRPLREFILEQGRPSHVIRFPSRRFGTVNFGYAHLCIIAGNRGKLEPGGTVVWSETTDGDVLLSLALEQGEALSGAFLADQCENGWVHPSHLDAVRFDRATVPLGTLAECRTGIYTGNNVQFCGFDSKQPPSRSANGHPIEWSSCVRTSSLRVEEQRDGIEGSFKYVQFVRGGHRRAFGATKWALDWSKAAVETYRTDEKARLQNHSFYFREGLAIPMVTSGRLSASYMTGSVFDQGVVGVFPSDPALVSYLLIYLNSEQIAERAKAVTNPGANNSANYVKRIPIIVPTSAELNRARQIFERARSENWEATAHERDGFMSSLLDCAKLPAQVGPQVG